MRALFARGRQPPDPVDAVCLQLAYAQVRERAISTTIAAGVTGFLLAREVPTPRLVAWGLVVVFFNVLRLRFHRWFVSAQHGPEALQAALPTFVVLHALPALAWGLLIAVAGFTTSIWVLSVILLAIGGMMATGVGSTSSTPRVLVSSMALSLAPTSLHLLLSGDLALQSILLLASAHLAATSTATRRHHEELRKSISLRFENDRLLEQVRVEKENAERANAEKSRFVAAASHDVRQPLHAMGLFLESLAGTNLPDGSRHLVRSIELAHRSLVSLHEGLLEVSVLDAGGLTPRLRAAPLKTLFAVLENEAAPRAKEKGLSLRLAGPALTLQTDAELLLRVLRNLVANALKYTERGGVLVTARRRGERALLQVWDTGIGIPAEQLERVFDELHQVNNPERNRAAGLGLGLAIVRRLARALGAEVTVRSTLGRGSVFSLEVPLVREAKPAVRGGVVLLVDDDGLARTALATLLERWGYEVVATQSAEEALECLAELPAPAAVVTDLMLSGASGLELLAKVAASHPGALRVLITGDTAADLDERARAVGATCLRKPVTAATLEAALGAIAHR